MADFSNQIALFYGVGSEYVMAPLAEPFKEAGFEVVELDVLKNPAVQETIEAVHDSGKPICFISSVLAWKNDGAGLHGKAETPYNSTLSVMRYLKPRVSVFMPHDLINPVYTREIFLMNSFDIYVSCDSYTRRHVTGVRSIDAGWIRHHRALDEKRENLFPVVWFLSNYTSMFRNREKEGLKLCEPVLKQGVPVKLPTCPNVEEVEEMISDAGYKVIPASADNFEVIHEHETILVNDMSSVAWEAHLYGKPVVTMGIRSSTERAHSALIQSANFTVLREFSDFDVSRHTGKRKGGRRVLKPFDFDMLLRALA